MEPWRLCDGTPGSAPCKMGATSLAKVTVLAAGAEPVATAASAAYSEADSVRKAPKASVVAKATGD